MDSKISDVTARSNVEAAGPSKYMKVSNNCGSLQASPYRIRRKYNILRSGSGTHLC